MALVNWEDLNLSGKNIVVYSSILFAISGLYYKSIITDVETEKNTTLKFQVLEQKIGYLTERVKTDSLKNVMQDEKVRILEDSNLKRETIESSGYIPLKKK